MDWTTCYSPDGSVRSIAYDSVGNTPDAGHGAWDFDEEIEPEPMPVGRRRLLSGTGRVILGASAALSTFTAVQAVTTTRGLASALGADSADLPGAVPEAVAPPPRLVEMEPADHREWQVFRARFITPEGRVVDTGNNGVSHTEGQGWGMLFAVAFDDMATFDRILSWTRRNLARPGDSLHAWRYVPGQAQPVSDLNNATDGDLFIAWAMWRGAYRWGRPELALGARAMARDVLRLLVRPAGPRTVLLPAAFGFEHGGSIDLNPSYYCFPALRELSQALPSPVWGQLHDDGLSMISEGRFGRWQLPPDWLSVSRRDGALTPAAGWPARFSYDAIRVPLYLSWSRLIQPQVYDAFARFWHETNPTPAWVDLRSGNLASYPAPAGIAAIAKIATAPSKTALPHDFPMIRASTDYYSAALILLARLAWQEGLRV